MDSELTDLAGVKGITISTLQVKPSEGAFANGDKTKLNAIEASADVTDTANVTAAGALMDSELTDLAGVKGVTISTLQVKPSEGAFANGDKTKLNAIEASADVTDAANVAAAGAVMNTGNETIAGIKTFTSATPLVFEGATGDDFQTTIAITDPTADRTITLPDAAGTVLLTSSNLSVLAATTSVQLAGIISDETGSGALVFGTSPTLITPALGTPSAGVLTSCTGTAAGLTAGTVTTNANLSGEVISVGNAATISDNVIDEANLKVSNTPTNGYMLTAQSGDTGGLTWAASSGGISFDGTTSNGILTYKDSDEATVESNLTYDGTDILLKSSTTVKPVFEIKNTNDDNKGGILQFTKNGLSPANGDILGRIEFVGEDSEDNNTTYAKIEAKSTTVTTDAEQGSLSFYVAEFDGNLTKGMSIVGL